MSHAKQHDVLIAGGGPTGLMLAAELALAHVDVAVIERRANQDVPGSRALGLHTRTLEVFDQRGIADRFVSQGTQHPMVHFHVPLPVSDQPTRFNFTLGLWQRHTERILAEWVNELDVTFYRQREVVGLSQDDAGVDVDLLGGERVRARYLVGCDGGRSIVRKAAGIEFPGWDATISWLIAEGRYTQEPKWGFTFDAVGAHAIGKPEAGEGMRLVIVEPQVNTGSDPTEQDIRDGLIRVHGTDFGIHDFTWVSRFTDLSRQAADYRVRRVMLAGDAAHVHPPLGGHGLNLGVQDAVNLGWKLAQVVKGVSPESLLDTYHAERHPVGARVLHNTMAHVAIRRMDDRTKALGDYVSEFLQNDAVRRRMVAEIVALDIHYDFGDGHPLLGRRMPDLELETTDGTRRVFEYLHDASHVLLALDSGWDADTTGWRDRLSVVRARYEGVWDLPVLGSVSAPRAVLIRPDGHVAWVSNGSDEGLREALVRWCGMPNDD